MPDFTFTSPEGKSYTVSGPEGATKEQAFGMLQQQLSAGTAHADGGDTPAPAATPPASSIKDKIVRNLTSENPMNKLDAMQKPQPSPSLIDAGKAIGASTAFGGVVGALSPEILKGLSVAAEALPATRALAPALNAMGTAAAAARPALAAEGAISGATSETAGQVADMAGASKGTSEAARLVGGLGGGAAVGLTSKFVGGPLKTAWGMLQKVVGAEQDATKAVETARENLSALSEAGQPQHALHAALSKGVQADLKAADQAADSVMAEAHKKAADVAAQNPATATRIVDEAKARAQAIRSDASKRATALDKASDGKVMTAQNVLAKAAPELAKVGQVRELSDIGTDLRQAVTVKSGAEIEARNTAYKQLQAERDNIVQQKQAAGQTINQTPAYKKLQEDLKTRLGKHNGLAQTVDPGVRNAYEQVYSAINNPTDFHAVDDLRRRLGDVARGADSAEGYAAIGKQNAQRMYGQLKEAQEQFVGDSGGRNVQREMQSGYADASRDIAKFAGKSGKKVTAMDRMDPEAFASDPKNLPGHFFNSQQGVKDLRELTGNDQMVDRMANDYASRQLQGMSATQARNWARNNSDWTREVPGLTERIGQYGNKLEQIERVSSALTKRAGSLSTEAEATRKEASQSAAREVTEGVGRAARVSESSVGDQERILSEGRKAAETTRSEASKSAKALDSTLQSAQQPKAIAKILQNGGPESTEAARRVAQQPGGAKIVEDSARQVMRNMGEAPLRDTWTNQIGPMMKGALPADRYAMLNADVQRVLKAYKGKEARSMVERYVVAALASTGGMAARATQGNYER